MNRHVSAIVREQYAAIQNYPDITRDEAEARFPELLDYLRRNVSIVDVIRDAGVELEPVSSDISVGECPLCHGPVTVRSG